jgi:hypothetical protein
MKYFFTLVALVSLLAACGGGNSGSNDTFTVSKTTSGLTTTYSCPNISQADACRVDGNCEACTCTSGCTNPNAPAAKLKVEMDPTTLTVDAPGELTMTLTNPAPQQQTAEFKLNTAAGRTSATGIGFSAPCATEALGLGQTAINAKVIVPADATCSLTVTKRFSESGTPAFTLTDLVNVVLDGELPVVTVND